MFGSKFCKPFAQVAVFLMLVAGAVSGQAGPQAAPPAAPQHAPASATPPAPVAPTRADILRGAYGPYRANNDLLSYHLDIRVDPQQQRISGKNTIRFRMLHDDNRIQLDLNDALKIDKILLGATELKYQRDSGAVFIDFPETLKNGQEYSIA